jgi:hypothetical protein
MNDPLVFYRQSELAAAVAALLEAGVPASHFYLTATTLLECGWAILPPTEAASWKAVQESAQCKSD